MKNLSKEIQFLIPLIKEVGGEIMKIYNSDFSHKLKKDFSPLTKADLLANDILITSLKKNFDYDIISEESIHKISSINSKIWIIDPIDGTRDFILKTGDFAIQVGLIENGRPILGVVYIPVLDKLYFAEKNKGAFLEFKGEIKQLKISNNNKKIKDYILAISRHHFSEMDKKISEELNILNFKKMGSVGIKFGSIAENICDMCFYSTSSLGVWDGCAPEIILTEAGGLVFDILGNEILYNCSLRKIKNGIIGIVSKDKKDEVLKIFKEVKNCEI